MTGKFASKEEGGGLAGFGEADMARKRGVVFLRGGGRIDTQMHTMIKRYIAVVVLFLLPCLKIENTLIPYIEDT